VGQDKGDLGEQALSKVAEIGISSQLDEVEEIDVSIRANPIQLMQGEVESVAIAGAGMVMQHDLRMEKMELQTASIAINPLSAAFGKIELTRTTEASAQVVLTEADINRAFNSNFMREKLRGFDVTINGQPTSIDTQRVEFCLPGDGKFFLKAQIYVQQTDEIRQVAFTAEPCVSPDKRKVLLENVEYSEEQGLSSKLTEALLDQSSELLNLDNFELEGMTLRIRELKMGQNKLTLIGEAHIKQFPSS
jgi:LmeA-like phospholipid-binding